MTKSRIRMTVLLIAATIAGMPLSGCSSSNSRAFPTEWGAITGFMGNDNPVAPMDKDIDLPDGLRVAFFKSASKQTTYFGVLSHSRDGRRWRVVSLGAFPDFALCSTGVSVNWEATYVTSLSLYVDAGQMFGAWQGDKVDLHAVPGSQAAQHMPEHTYVTPGADGLWAAATSAAPSDVPVVAPSGAMVTPCQAR